MQPVIDALLHHDLTALIQAVGLFGVWGIIFAESGLLIGFFLPGDSLIFTAAFLATPNVGFFHIVPLLLGSWVAAVVGDNVGYEFGKRVGPRLFRREDSLLFKKENLIKAEEFYEKHGGKAIILARFMPVVRTFAPIVAGMGKMNHARFSLFNMVGGGLWVFGVGLTGYFAGSMIPEVDKYLLPIILGIMVLSILPPVIHFYRESKQTPVQHLSELLKRALYYVKSFLPEKSKEQE